ncbi:Dabb family protein [Flagellimonas sp.]|uniref:Dabb family protein n=1 Tax=Flagellimonas sp. TaxID=2058762 RepID=UPI003B5C6BBF
MLKNKALIYIFFIFCCVIGCKKTGEFHHVLLYSWSEDAADQNKGAFLEIFENLPSAIKGLENVHIVKLENSLDRHDILIDMTFSSKTILKSYQNHPDHQKIEQYAIKVIQDYSYFQYTMK